MLQLQYKNDYYHIITNFTSDMGMQLFLSNM